MTAPARALLITKSRSGGDLTVETFGWNTVPTDVSASGSRPASAAANEPSVLPRCPPLAGWSTSSMCSGMPGSRCRSTRPKIAAQPEEVVADLFDGPGEALLDDRDREPITGVHRVDQPVAERLAPLPLLLRVGGRVVLLGRPRGAHRGADTREIGVAGELVRVSRHPGFIAPITDRP